MPSARTSCYDRGAVVDFFSVLVILALVVGLIYVQIAARQQVNVDTALSPDETAVVIKKYFGMAWNDEGGPGDFNYAPKIRKDPPTISVRVEPSAAGSHVSIWASGSMTMLGIMGHAFLVWRKKRGLAAKLGRR